MSDNKAKVEAIVQQLIRLTKESKIDWHYIDSNDDFQKYVDQVAKFYVPSRASINCFYAKIASGYYLVVEIIPILSKEPSTITFVVIPSLNCRDIQYQDKPQSDLVRLHNLIKKQFPNVDSFLDESLESLQNL